MSISIHDVEYVAQLARLEFSQAEKEKLTLQLGSILGYVGKLDELDTTNVEPLSYVNEPHNVLRDDIPFPSYSLDEALRNAPAKTETFFKVPNVLGKKT